MKDSLTENYYYLQLANLHSHIEDTLTLDHKIECIQDARNYIVRLKAIKGYLEQAKVYFKDLVGKPECPSKDVFLRVAKEMEEFCQPGVATDHILYKHFEFLFNETFYTDYPFTESKQNKHELLAQAKKIIESEVYPAYKEMVSFLRDCAKNMSPTSEFCRVADFK